MFTQLMIKSCWSSQHSISVSTIHLHSNHLGSDLPWHSPYTSVTLVVAQTSLSKALICSSSLLQALHQVSLYRIKPKLLGKLQKALYFQVLSTYWVSWVLPHAPPQGPASNLPVHVSVSLHKCSALQSPHHLFPTMYPHIDHILTFQHIVSVSRSSQSLSWLTQILDTQYLLNKWKKPSSS